MGLLTAEELREVDSEVQGLIRKAVEFAEASEAPTPEEVLTDVYVSYEGSSDA
jgi:pyruvate dehydrogenase E1 component alpha subunit